MFIIKAILQVVFCLNCKNARLFIILWYISFLIIVVIKSFILYLLQKEHRCITSVSKCKLNKNYDGLLYMRQIPVKNQQLYMQDLKSAFSVYF